MRPAVVGNSRAFGHMNLAIKIPFKLIELMFFTYNVFHETVLGKGMCTKSLVINLSLYGSLIILLLFALILTLILTLFRNQTL